jgi:hypothetical protein
LPPLVLGLKWSQKIDKNRPLSTCLNRSLKCIFSISDLSDLLSYEIQKIFSSLKINN